MFKIEKGVKMPQRGDGSEWGEKYPFRKMEIGDSFAFQKSDYNRVASSMYSYMKKKPPLKFVIREVENGVRCWRVK